MKIRTKPSQPDLTEPCLFHGVPLHRVKDPTPFRRWLAEATGTTAFPGPLPISLEKAHFKKFVHSDKWYIADKTDGVRALMVCTSLLGYKMCCLVDRTLGFYAVPLKGLPKVLFQDTVFDGELVQDKKTGRWVYLAFDALVVSGVTVHSCSFTKRLTAVAHGLSDYTCQQDDVLELRMKEFSRADAWDYRHVDKRYAADGVVIVANDAAVVYGRGETMYKLKPPGSHTVDFQVAEDGVGLLVFDLAIRGMARVAELPKPMRPGCIVECPVNGHGKVTAAGNVRYDKLKSNDKLTYNKTVLNAMENICVQDLYRVFTNRN